MIEKQHKKFLTVAPFECAWRNDLRFREAGRGCVAFEAAYKNWEQILPEMQASCETLKTN